MSDHHTSSRPRRRDHGFTLTEILIVTGLMGILAAALATAFTAVVRTTPDAEERITDARSLKGLVTWLPQDMDATPPDGFDVGTANWSCSGAAPSDSHNVVAMTWTEVGASTTVFHASYRYELVGADWRMVRYTCQNGGSAARSNMTSELPAWDAGSPPAFVDMCATTVDTNGDCPAGSAVTDPTVQTVESLKMTLTLLDGSLYTIDAAAKNPDEDLKDDPDAVTNLPPAAAVADHHLTMLAGETAVLDLYATHGIADPEGDVLTSARDSYEPMPHGITVTASDPLQLEVRADPALTAGALADPIPLIVSDAFGGSVEITVSVEIVEPPNAAPTAVTATSTVTVGQGQTVIVPLDLTHGIADPNGDSMTIDVLSWPAPLASKPDVGPPLGELRMAVTAKATAAVGPVLDPVVVRVRDEHGLFVDVLTLLEIVPPSTNNPPTVASTTATVDMEAGDDVTLAVGTSHGATDPDGDLIWVELDPLGAVPGGLTVTTSGLDVTITADAGLTDGALGSVPLRVVDERGDATAITVEVVILLPPPPPSDCVLGTLAVDHSSVGRHGKGGGPRELVEDVLVTLTYSGNCDGLVLKYDTGHPSSLGGGIGRVFPTGSPTSIVLVGYDNGGTEKWTAGGHVLTASTTSDAAPSSIAITLSVT